MKKTVAKKTVKKGAKKRTPPDLVAVRAFFKAGLKYWKELLAKYGAFQAFAMFSMSASVLNKVVLEDYMEHLSADKAAEGRGE